MTDDARPTVDDRRDGADHDPRPVSHARRMSMTDDARPSEDRLREALTEWESIEGSSLADQFRAFIAAGKMADAIRAALAASRPAPDTIDVPGLAHAIAIVLKGWMVSGETVQLTQALRERNGGIRAALAASRPAPDTRTDPGE